MSIILIDIPVIKKEDVKEWKKLIGKKLRKVETEYDENLILDFGDVTVRVSRQYSDAYGDNVFWNFERRK
jgi:hypothetical protein